MGGGGDGNGAVNGNMELGTPEERVGERDKSRDLKNLDAGLNRIQAIQGLPWRGGGVVHCKE